MAPIPSAVRWAIRLIRLTAPLVPRAARSDWRAEWEAELLASADEMDGLDRWTSSRRLLRRASGAPADAFWMRQRALADVRWIDDLRHGWRQLGRQKAFALTTVGILALSMAGTVVAFAVVSQVLRRPLPYPEPDRVVTVWERQASMPGRNDVAPGNFLDWRDRATSFERLAAVEPYSYDYLGGDRPEVLKALNVTEGFFEVFGIAPLHGRFFRPDEHRTGANQVVVLGARLWRTRFAADPAIVGRAIPLRDRAYVVVGIAPDDFEPHLLEQTAGSRDLFAAKVIQESEPRIRASGYWNVVGRLRRDVSIDQGRAELEAISAHLEAELPRSNTGVRSEVITLREHLVGDVRPAVALFAAAVVAVLLIACVNVTNLLLVRGTGRQQELAVRTALGASRRRLVGQLLVETLLLSSLASLVAVALAAAAMRLLAAAAPREVLWIDTLHVNSAVVAFAAGLAAAVAAAAGLVPALRLSADGLQAASHRTMTGDRAQRRLRSSLVVAEVALAVMLVAGTGLLLKSFVQLLRVDTGFRRDGVVALQMFAWNRNPTPAALRTYFARVVDAVQSLPRVEAVGGVQAMPFIEANVDIRSVVDLIDRPKPAAGEEVRASINVVMPGYFRVMGVRLVAGRLLDDRDGADAPRAVIVSEALAARHLQGVEPIGQRIAFRNAGRPIQAQIVGVVGSLRHDALDQAPRAEVLVPFEQSPSGSITLLARTTGDPRGLIAPAQAAIWNIDPLQTFYRVATLDELVTRTLRPRRFTLVVLTGFAALALLLAAAGLYGVLSAIASQYRREMGVRIALGAGWLDIMRLVLLRGMAVAAVGTAVGLVGVIGLGRVMAGFLFSVAPADPWAVGGAALLVLAVTTIACVAPALRAANVDPVETLRVE